MYVQYKMSNTASMVITVRFHHIDPSKIVTRFCSINNFEKFMHINAKRYFYQIVCTENSNLFLHLYYILFLGMF